ncbi:MAG TPA: hypothetical protein VJL28_11495 [Gemmatimonadaceae bacterium]|nr:hypothetical protein [Gemmatimonadaceae bacterium]
MPFSTFQGTQPPVPPIPKMEAPPPIARPAQAGTQGPVTTPGSPGPGGPQTTPGVLVPPPRGRRGPDIPTGAVDISVAFFTTFAICIIGYPLARAFARRIDRRTEALRIGGSDVTPQLRQLQDSVDAMAIEIERISEAQRFSSKLLAERVGVAPKVEGTAR